MLTETDIARFEDVHHLHVPPEYRALLLRYALTDVEVVGPPGTSATTTSLDAIAHALQPDQEPFVQRYRAWGVIPIGTDLADNRVVMVIRETALGWPLGSIWAFDPAWWERPYSYVSATCIHALRNALWLRLCAWHDASFFPRPTPEAARQALDAFDPTIQGHTYWDTWIAQTVARET